MSSEIHVGDIVQFESTIKDQDDATVDLSSATTNNFLFQRPDGSLLTVEGSFLTDGSDGVVIYRTSNTDLNQAGSWRYQVYLIYDSNEQHTDITKFKVLGNLPLV
jgi:hypothetical protein